MTQERFRENSCLANDILFFKNNTINQDSAYFVNIEWLEQLFTTHSN